MNTKLSTTQEQSARLLRCGVSADTADMCWIAPNRLVTGGVGFPTLMCAEYFKHDDSIHQTPAWSLGALLGLLPKEIDIDGYKYRISIYFESPDEPVIGNQWCLFYKPKKHNEKSHYIDDVPMYATDLIECSILMIEWLTANGYKLNEI